MLGFLSIRKLQSEGIITLLKGNIKTGGIPQDLNGLHNVCWGGGFWGFFVELAELLGCILLAILEQCTNINKLGC